jgi:hypothetical protein
MGYPITQSTANQPLQFWLIASTDHLSGLTGKAASVVVKISKNGAAAVTPTGAITEVDATNIPGLYQVAANATDSNTLGPLVLHAKDAASDPFDDTFPVVAYNPLTATNLGLTALPTVAPNANGGLPILSSAGTTLAYTISTLTTYTGNTPQTGDNFARLGAPAGASVSADIAAAKADTGTLTTRIPGTVQPQTGDAFARLGAPIGASISADIQTRSTYAGGAVASVTAPVTVGSLGAGSISTATFAAGATIPAVAQVNGPNITLSGTVSDSAPLPSSFKVAGLPNVPGVTYPGMTLVFTSGNLQGVHRSIATDLGGAAPRTLTFTTAYPVSPANGDAFIILA